MLWVYTVEEVIVMLPVYNKLLGSFIIDLLHLTMVHSPSPVKLFLGVSGALGPRQTSAYNYA